MLLVLSMSGLLWLVCLVCVGRVGSSSVVMMVRLVVWRELVMGIMLEKGVVGGCC